MRVSYSLIFYDSGDRIDKKQTGFVLKNAFARFLIQLVDLKSIRFVDDNGDIVLISDAELRIIEEGLKRLCELSNE